MGWTNPHGKEKTMSSTVTINGKTYTGDNVTMRNGKVIIDGKEQEGETLSGVVEVRIKGTLENLECDASVKCGDVTGSVSAGGSVKCGDVGGSVNTGGSLKCGHVGGSVNAGGSVKHG